MHLQRSGDEHYYTDVDEKKYSALAVTFAYLLSLRLVAQVN